MQAVAGNGLVSAGDDGHSGFVQRADDLDVLLKLFFVKLSLGRWRANVIERLCEFDGKFKNPGLEAGRRFGSGCGEILHQRERWIDRGVMRFEKGKCRLRCG
jgi:hypothetical protein